MKWMAGLIFITCTVMSAVAAQKFARPSAADQVGLMQEVEAAAKSNARAIAGGREAIRKQHARYVELEEKRQAIFADAAPCSHATQAARSLWVSMVQYDLGPNDFSYKVLADRQQDYRESMTLCQQSLYK